MTLSIKFRLVELYHGRSWSFHQVSDSTFLPQTRLQYVSNCLNECTYGPHSAPAAALLNDGVHTPQAGLRLDLGNPSSMHERKEKGGIGSWAVSLPIH